MQTPFLSRIFEPKTIRLWGEVSANSIGFKVRHSTRTIFMVNWRHWRQNRKSSPKALGRLVWIQRRDKERIPIHLQRFMNCL